MRAATAHVRYPEAGRPVSRRTTRRMLFLMAAVAALVSAASAVGGAQEGVRPRRVETRPAPAVGGDDEVITVETAEVLLPVTVRDAAGRLVTTLTREDFRVFEDGREQPLSALDLRRVPVDVVMMIDSSSSVTAEVESFRRAAGEFAERLGEEDRFCLVQFDDRVTLLQDWTRSRTQFRRALRRITPGMFTRFNDALYLSAREQFRAGGRHRRAVVVLTDGIDSGRGSVTAEGALKALLESQAAVYVIGNTEIERARKQSELASLLDARGASPGMNALKVEDLREGLRVLDASESNLGRLCDSTGGKFYRPRSFDALGSVYAEVADELRSQYALYYTPLDKSRDGKFRRVEVRTRDGSQRVAARVGYYARRG